MKANSECHDESDSPNAFIRNHMSVRLTNKIHRGIPTVITMEIGGKLRERFVFICSIWQLIQLGEMGRCLDSKDVCSRMAVDFAKKMMLNGPREVTQVASKPYSVGYQGLDLPSLSLGLQTIDPSGVVVFKKSVWMV